ncbi:MAG: hypothetical protein RR211_04590, partial [Pseudoflavonifractor sp.]
SYAMTEPAGSEYQQSQMKKWSASASGVWNFAEGIYPRLSWQKTSDPKTLVKHIAVTYTQAGGEGGKSSNVYVRYQGATLSGLVADAALIKQTGNERMVVAIAEGNAPLTLTLAASGSTRNVQMIPGIQGRGGYADMSIYRMNPDGMWKDQSGNLTRSWTIYNPDALMGLSQVFAGATVDGNGVPRPAAATAPGTKPADRIELGGDISMAAYSRTGALESWQPIGAATVNTATGAKPFNMTFDGKGFAVTDLVIYEVEATQEYSGTSWASHYRPRADRLGFFGTVDGGTVQNLVLAAGVPDTRTDRNPNSLHTSTLTPAAGGLVAELKNGKLENCLVDLPVYGAVKADTPVGGLVGQVTGTASILNCAYTGYVYTAASAETIGHSTNGGKWLPFYSKTISGKNNPLYIDPATQPPASGGTVGGLVGSIASGANLTLTGSYAAGYIEGNVMGGLVGQVLGTANVTDCAYDRNASGQAVEACGKGTSFTAADAVPTAMTGADWSAAAEPGFYPVQKALEASAVAKAPRIRVEISAHAKSATTGSITAPSGNFVTGGNKQPVLVGSAPGTITILSGSKSFEKKTDGIIQLELKDSSSNTRRVLANIKCWYDDPVIVNGVKHYVVSSAAELAELAELVNGTISTGKFKGHNHKNADGSLVTIDSFKDKVVNLGRNVDLSTLKDADKQVSQWTSIGNVANSFQGTFDGKGFAVSGMRMTASAVAGAVKVPTAGLFGTVSGKVQNLLVTDAAVRLELDGTLGGLVATQVVAGGSIENCGSSGTVSAGGGQSLGGIVGENAGSISGCFSTAELTQRANTSGGKLGGLAGKNTGNITNGAFTGYCDGGSIAAGIAAENTGSISACYTAAYLSGTAGTYASAPGTVSGCKYDGRYTKNTLEKNGTTRADGASLSMPAGWTPGTGTSEYPHFAAYDALSKQPLGLAAKLAATQFTFGGIGNASYAHFGAVEVSAFAPPNAGKGFLEPEKDSKLLSIKVNRATPNVDVSGNTVLRIGSNLPQLVGFRNPCYLSIPAALAVTYRFDWSALMMEANKNKNYHGTGAGPTNTWAAPTGSGEKKVLLSTKADLEAFIAYVNTGNNTEGYTFQLDYNINVGGSPLSPMTGVFNGTFDGGSYTISNYSASGPLFAEVGPKGQVTKLGLSGVTLNTNLSATGAVGLIAGTNQGRISNVAAEGCSVAVNQNGTAATTKVGGLVGENNGVLDDCYLYTNDVGKVSASVSGTLHLGGLVGRNTGLVRGCYSIATPTGTVNSTTSDFKNFSAMVGLNDGGQIVYSYWMPDANSTGAINPEYTAYKNQDGSSVLATALSFRDKDVNLVARWLSADSYGGTYYAENGRLKLDSFRMAQYDFTNVFTPEQGQEMMLALQYGAGEEIFFSNGLLSWKNYQFPNYADLPLTASLALQMPILSSKLTYAVTQANAIRKNTAVLGELSPAGFSLAGGIYTVLSGENAVRVLID